MEWTLLEQPRRLLQPGLEMHSSNYKTASNRQTGTYLWPSPWRTSLKASRAPWGRGLTLLGVLPPPMRWCTAPLWQTSAELRAGRHRTPSQDSTVSALSQFLPVCCVTGNGREELTDVTLAAPFLLTRGYERLFSPPVQFPGR